MTNRAYVVLIDFDGTLVTSRWPGIGDALPGAAEAVRTLMDQGCIVRIWSVRANYPVGRHAIRQWLDERGLHGVEIETAEKPLFDLLVDDRAMFFPGKRRSWYHLPVKVVTRLAVRKPLVALAGQSDDSFLDASWVIRSNSSDRA